MESGPSAALHFLRVFKNNQQSLEDRNVFNINHEGLDDMSDLSEVFDDDLLPTDEDGELLLDSDDESGYEDCLCLSLFENDSDEGQRENAS